MKNKLSLFLVFIFFIACKSKDKSLIEDISYSDIDSIILINPKSEYIDLTHNENFKIRFRELKAISGIWKFIPRKLIIKNVNRADTILTDGVIFRYKNSFYMTKEKENILNGIIKEVNLKDTIVIENGNVSD